MHIKEARNVLMIAPKDMFNARDMFISCGGYWSYSGQEEEPHALLTSGNHSDAYFSTPIVTQFSNLRRLLAEQLVMKLIFEGIKKIDVVISSSYAAFTIGQSLADALGVISFYTEKVDGRQAWTGRFDMPEDAIILQVEELITTIGTTSNVRDAILKCNPNAKFVTHKGKTVVATIIHRPSKLPKEYPDYSVVALHEEEVHSWKPDECPLCERGSRVLKPKENWSEFTKFVKM